MKLLPAKCSTDCWLFQSKWRSQPVRVGRTQRMAVTQVHVTTDTKWTSYFNPPQFSLGESWPWSMKQVVLRGPKIHLIKYSVIFKLLWFVQGFGALGCGGNEGFRKEVLPLLQGQQTKRSCWFMASPSLNSKGWVPPDADLALNFHVW